jgi:hypothetical protein
MPRTAGPNAKPDVKLASTLVLFGMGIFAIERFGLSRIEGPTGGVHLDPNLLSVLVIAPLVLVVAGAVVFVVGRMRRL